MIYFSMFYLNCSSSIYSAPNLHSNDAYIGTCIKQLLLLLPKVEINVPCIGWSNNAVESPEWAGWTSESQYSQVQMSDVLPPTNALCESNNHS